MSSKKTTTSYNNCVAAYRLYGDVVAQLSKNESITLSSIRKANSAFRKIREQVIEPFESSIQAWAKEQAGETGFTPERQQEVEKHIEAESLKHDCEIDLSDSERKSLSELLGKLTLDAIPVDPANKVYATNVLLALDSFLCDLDCDTDA